MDTTYEGMTQELKKIRPQLLAFILLANDDPEALDIERLEALNERGQFLCDVLDEVDAQLSSQPAAAQKSEGDTLDLMNKVASHLCGRDVTVMQAQPIISRHALGETWHDGQAVKIALAPSVFCDAESLLTIFLHEVAHAKLHTDHNGIKDGDAAKMEAEAMRQQRYWQHYASTHTQRGIEAGGINQIANDFRLQLFTLLDSEEAARKTIMD